MHLRVLGQPAEKSRVAAVGLSALAHACLLIFVVLLVVLLAMSIVAVIRLPPWSAWPPEGDTRPAAAQQVPAGAPGRPRDSGHPAGPPPGPLPVPGTVSRPQVSGRPPWELGPKPGNALPDGPPWEPAPQPPGDDWPG